MRLVVEADREDLWGPWYRRMQLLLIDVARTSGIDRLAPRCHGRPVIEHLLWFRRETVVAGGGNVDGNSVDESTQATGEIEQVHEEAAYA